MSRLIHYADKPLTAVHSVQQGGADDYRPFKPKGLWVSVEGDDDWPSWCKSEGFALEKLACATEVVLRDAASILWIKDADELDRFSEEYAYDPFAMPLAMRNKMAARWWVVAERWQGIIIAPHIYSRRLSPQHSWYYSWDCASGCIWDGDAVAELRQLMLPVSEEAS